MVAILLYVTAHQYITGQTPHSGVGNNMFNDGECYNNTPSKILVHNRLNIQQEISSLYQWQVFTIYSCCYFFLKWTCHTLESIISLSLKWLSRYLLTNLQSIALMKPTFFIRPFASECADKMALIPLTKMYLVFYKLETWYVCILDRYACWEQYLVCLLRAQ